MLLSKKIGTYTYSVGDEVVYDSSHGYTRGKIERFGANKLYLRIEGTAVLQQIKFTDIRPHNNKVHTGKTDIVISWETAEYLAVLLGQTALGNLQRRTSACADLGQAMGTRVMLHSKECFGDKWEHTQTYKKK